MPPHTLGMVSPACCATLTNWTGEVVGPDTAASIRAGSLHFHRGVVRASVSVLPSMKREEPRKRRRGKIIDCDDYRDSDVTAVLPRPALRPRSVAESSAAPAKLLWLVPCRSAVH